MIEADGDTLRVRPVEGRRLPLEGDPTRSVDKSMEVPNSRYYRAAIKRGDIEATNKHTREVAGVEGETHR